VSLGYTDVYCFRGGLPEWIQAGYPVASTEKLPKAEVPDLSPADLKKLLDETAPVTVLDLRPASEVAKYWISSPHRVNVPFDELPDRVGEVPTGKRVVAVDVNGKRTSLATRYLVAKGFTDVAKLSGGMERWLKEGLPTEVATK